MKNRGFRRFVVSCLGAAGLLFAVSAPCAAVKGAAPVQGMSDFQDLGGGLYAYPIPFTPEMRERLLAAIPAEEPIGGKAAQTFFAISAGQSPAPPTDPITTPHGALSDATFPYQYWFIVLNLGTRNLTRRTTFKLSGPGLKFNKTFNFTYNANGIWLVGYFPNAGVRVPGVYTYQATVEGGGTITNKSFAVLP